MLVVAVAAPIGGGSWLDGWHTLPAALGLAVLGSFDLWYHRLPSLVLRASELAVVALMLAQAAHHGAWQPVGRAAAGAVVAGVLLGAVWLAVPGGLMVRDVEITSAATAAAAAVSWLAASRLVLVAFTVGGLLAVCSRLSGRPDRPAVPRTVPHAPGLFIGFVVGVSVR